MNDAGKYLLFLFAPVILAAAWYTEAARPPWMPPTPVGKVVRSFSVFTTEIRPEEIAGATSLLSRVSATITVGRDDAIAITEFTQVCPDRNEDAGRLWQARDGPTFFYRHLLDLASPGRLDLRAVTLNGVPAGPPGIPGPLVGPWVDSPPFGRMRLDVETGMNRFTWRNGTTCSAVSSRMHRRP